MNIKNLPYACKKSQLCSKLIGISDKDILEQIYTVIINNRKCDIEKAKSIRIVYKNEVRAVMVALGELE